MLRRSDQERGSRDMSRFFNEEEYNFNKGTTPLFDLVSGLNLAYGTACVRIWFAVGNKCLLIS